jgi:hypothetical protein
MNEKEEGEWALKGDGVMRSEKKMEIKGKV